MKSISFKEQLEAFGNNIYLDSDGNESWCFNFYDWFCEDSELEDKSYKLFCEASKFFHNFGVDVDSHYVFFKNNCPLSGELYDSFSICEIESGDVVYWVTPKSGHTGLAEICGVSNDFETPLHSGSSLSSIYQNLK